ncbi:MAG: RlmE family RNA methyltransferase [Rhodobiaceae bacterium]|nr:RlmE family RNA methyltransferase [Rhodobiaceae bacterium]MCC0014919.1 RlmE family RNA methyltransferase [Rhodobiaceae bacterium]MCC0018190.1 RlmE family RNA methyltransferase [Rhodobiaceae bacterium]MCC0041678.1 RlmE family RNA methyltransferase [Rhodobiaceae bacterium]MCC0053073.1 RlmE family RNA methyltransferase [Rhodobiaceae bacterium]
MTKSPGGSGRSSLKTRVKTARKRSTSSTRWLQRQLNDPYVEKARAAGYRSRAAFKLVEIDEKHPLLKPGMRVLDLGAAPGGWTQVAAERIAPDGKLVAIDILEMDPVPGADVLQLDFLDADAPEKLRAALGGPVDLVLSDMAASTTGHRQTDHLRTMALFEAAYDFACEVLAPGGAFLAKVFRGGTEQSLLADMKRRFRSVRHVKPPSSRPESVELYVLAEGFRGGDNDE